MGVGGRDEGREGGREGGRKEGRGRERGREGGSKVNPHSKLGTSESFGWIDEQLIVFLFMRL